MRMSINLLLAFVCSVVLHAHVYDLLHAHVLFFRTYSVRLLSVMHLSYQSVTLRAHILYCCSYIDAVR
jgi:hypothetical protein